MRSVIRLMMCLLPVVLAAAEEPVRAWTSAAGTKLEARLKAFDGTTATLEGNGKTYSIQAGALAEEDQRYLKDYREKLVQERLQRLGVKRGQFTLGLDARMFPTDEGYYGTRIGKTMFQAIKKSGKDPLELVRHGPEGEQAMVYVPAHYDGEKPFGLYVHISPGDGPDMPGYQSILDERDMIMASPFKGGNEQEEVRRIVLALDTAATLKKMYRIDDARVYVGGMSGGGIMAMQAQLNNPEVWAGAISHARGMNTGNFKGYHTETKCFTAADFNEMSKMKQRFAVISGPDDFNYAHCQKSSAAWKQAGFDIRFFDVPGMGHGNAPAADFEKALDWVREANARKGVPGRPAIPRPPTRSTR